MGLIRPDVDQISGYTPGEQPQESGWIKLNTNENPYPPSPKVVEAIQRAASGRLNIYPDPLVRQFCRLAGETFGVDPDAILPANGSDENLTILLRTFVDPGELVSYPYPSYILYETLAELQGARHARIPLAADWSWDAAVTTPIVQASKLVMVPNPNSPSGNCWSLDEITALIPDNGLVVLDEAYADFCDQPVSREILQTDRTRQIIVTRTLSKSYSLAGIRFGFAIADPEWIRGMRKVKDSYNCNTLSIAAAVAAFEDQDWMRANVERIRTTRKRMTAELRSLGFEVVESQANFVWATHPEQAHEGIYKALKARRVLVRYMRFPLESPAEEEQVLDGLRITVGTDSEVDGFLAALKDCLAV